LDFDFSDDSMAQISDITRQPPNAITHRNFQNRRIFVV